MAESYSFERYLNVRTANGASFSPDGKHISFLTDISGVVEVWSVPVEMTAEVAAWRERLTLGGERVVSATFAPTGDMLLVSDDVGGNERTQLHTLTADGTSFRKLTDRPEVIYQFGDWSADGTRITYASNERDNRFFDVYERPVAGGEPGLLLQEDGSNYARRYSGDGRFVLAERFDFEHRQSTISRGPNNGRGADPDA